MFSSAALGTLSTPSTTVVLTSGGTATRSGTVTAESDVAEGRQLFGALTVVTDQGAVVGTGSVVVGSVVTG